MLKPPSVKPLGGSKEVAQLLRPVPTLKQIPGLLKEEAREQFLYGPKNSMNYYFIPPEKNSPEKKTGNPVEKAFKSIHGNVETREKQRIIEKLSDPKYNFIEKQALKEVRKKQGKLYLLGDIYTEITKEVAEKSKTDVRPSKKKQIRFHLEEEEKMVEELERWEKLTVKNKSKAVKESENPNEMSDIKHDSKHFVLPQIKRPPAVETNVSGVVLDKFLKRNASQRSSIAIPISLEGENLNGLELPSPIHHVTETLSMVKFEDGYLKDDHENDRGLIKIVDVMQQDEDLEGVKAQIYKMMEGEDDMDFSGENIKSFSLKNIALLCRGINQDMEDKVELSLNETSSEVKDRENLLKRLEEEQNKLNQELSQLNRQIEKLGYNKRNQDDYAFLENEDRRLWDEDREMDAHLRNEVDETNYKILENHAATLKAEKEFKEYKGKLVNIQTLQKQLYKAILLQGLDTKEEGLLWIVRKLFEIGDPATQKDFPRYLDQKSRKYIIERLKAQNKIKTLNNQERSVIDNFRKSKETIDVNTQLSSALLNTSKNNFENSKVLHSIQGEFRSSVKTGSLRSSAELPRNSVKSAFRIDTLDSSLSPETRKTIGDETLGGRDSSRENLHTNSKHGSELNSPATATLPTEENDDESWHGVRSEARKWSRFTENEEIYKNAKIVMRDIMKKEGEMRRPQMRSRTYAPFTMEKQKSILKTPSDSIFSNNYDTRRDFLLKMQNFHQDLQSKQEKMKEEYETEVTRIVTEHGNPRKNVDLGVYLMAVIGPSETIKYFNKFGIREERPI